MGIALNQRLALESLCLKGSLHLFQNCLLGGADGETDVHTAGEHAVLYVEHAANTGECAGFRVSAGDAQSVAVGAAVGEQLCQRLAVCESAVAAQVGQQTGDGVVTALRCGGMGCNALVGEFVLAPGNLTALFFRAAERRREADRGIRRNGVWRSAGGEAGDGVCGLFGEPQPEHALFQMDDGIAAVRCKYLRRHGSVRQIIGEVGGAVFLVAAQQEPDVFPEGDSGSFDGTEGVQDRHSRSFVVNGSSAVDAAVSDFGGERIRSPVLRNCRNYVQVAENAQMGRQGAVPVGCAHVVIIVGAGHAEGT